MSYDGNSQSSRSSRDISFLSFLLSFLTGFGGGLDSAALKEEEREQWHECVKILLLLITGNFGSYVDDKNIS